jgi:pilus assembly protein CpaC
LQSHCGEFYLARHQEAAVSLRFEFLAPLVLRLLTIFFALLASSLLSANASAESNIVLGTGRSTDVTVPKGAGAISVSNGSILKVKDLGHSLHVTGKKAGACLIKAGSLSFNVTVLSEMRYALYENLRRSLQGKRGLQLGAETTTGSGVITVSGRLLRWADWLDLATAAQSSPQEFEFTAEIEESVLAEARRYFSKTLRADGLPELSLQFLPQASVVLPTEPEDLKARVAKVLRPFGFRIERSPSSLALEPLVRVKIIVAEIRKRMMSQLGISWPGSIDAQLLPSFAAPTESGLSVTLNALEASGIGRILASPVLLCRSGKEAHFLAGGEFPIKTSTRIRSEVMWKRYGVLLNIKPVADFGGRMSIALETEVSTIDASNKIDGVPGLLTNRIETHFDLTSSRTIALSGLIRNESAQNSQGLPGLSSLPIIGSLFSSREYLDNKTELVVLVTPEVVHPDKDGL